MKKLYYTKKCLFYNLYPLFIIFLKHIREKNRDNYIGFLSRDSYFLYLLYKQMYPNLVVNKDFSYIYSSRQCFTNFENNNYYEYILYFKNKNNDNNLLLIDVYGTGNSFLEFINYYDIKNINLLFINHNSKSPFYLKHLKNKHLVTGYCNLSFKNNKTWKYINNGIYLEAILRAPHKKIIGVLKNNHNSYKPIFLDKDSDYNDNVNDIDKHLLIKLYNNTLHYIKYNKNIRYFALDILENTTLYTGSKFNINNDNKTYEFLLALDIDDTITNLKNYKYIKKVIKYC